jgi:membrane glycosyltransferase
MLMPAGFEEYAVAPAGLRPRIDLDEFGACRGYVDRLSLLPDQRRELLEGLSWFDARQGDGLRGAMSALHQALSSEATSSSCDHPDNAAYPSIQRRLELAYGRQDGRAPKIDKDALGRERLVTSPPVARTSMAARRWPRGLLGRWLRIPVSRRMADETPHASAPSAQTVSDSPDPVGRWHRAAGFRRIIIAGLVVSQTYIAANFMSAVLPYHGQQGLEVAILIFFTILFGWISAGFWTAIAGFVLLLFDGDRFAISRSAARDSPIDPGARVAIVMPICNENVARVYAGLRATYDSLQRTGELDHFDFFVLSDSSNPDTRVAEIAAWVDLCRAVGGFGRVFYRWRQHRIKRKSGNVADFCRRWGRNYRYMVVLDADSVMSGDCLTALVRVIEANPNAGIIQTAPRAAGRDTFYARVQQFATRVYGPLFTAGLHFWQLGESHYWGHNAIIRIAPFMRHCALRRLPGRGMLSGEILSHDFVEAALMRRAGWAVWIAYDLAGSYEEMPPNLIDELTRDRRWCLGNLMNFRLFMMKGLHVAHRAVFMSGVMAYLSALLWFTFLVLSTALVAVQTLSAPKYFVQPFQLFPLWPEWHPEWAIALFSATAVFLFLPKILAVALLWVRGATRYGGALRLGASMLCEFALSALLAPIRMLFHTQFVVGAFSRWTLHWKSPQREDAETTWREAAARHGGHTLLGMLWAGVVYWLNPSYVWWLLPVVGALMVSIPLSVLTSRVSVGRRLRKAGLFVIPEELRPPPEIQSMMQGASAAPKPPGFIEAVVDPVVNALSCASGVARFDQDGALRSGRHELVRFALQNGPAHLTAAQKVRLLNDPVALSRLHLDVWTSPQSHAQWRQAIASSGVSAGIVGSAPRRFAEEPAPLEAAA